MKDMDGKFTRSCKIPCPDGVVAVSPDGRLFATKSTASVVISNCSTLQSVFTIPKTGSVSKLTFSPDSKHISWLCKDPVAVNLYEIETKNRLELSCKPGLDVISIFYGPNCLIYTSELEIFIGVYDLKRHAHFTLEGCSVDDFNRPLLVFSPNGDYLCYIRDHHVVIYKTETWTRVAEFACLICPILPRFVCPYTIFLANHEGSAGWFSIFGSKLKTESFLASCCVVETELAKDGRHMYAATYDNKVLRFDSISMKSRLELKYDYNFKSLPDVRVFIVNDEVASSNPLRHLKYTENLSSRVKELKNIMDEFKRKTLEKHLMALNHDDTLLATFNPANPGVIWIWDLSKSQKLSSLLCLSITSGRVKKLQWHRRFNVLAVSCANLVVIWTQGEDIVAFPGDSVDFKWLNSSVPIGVLVLESHCRFIGFSSRR